MKHGFVYISENPVKIVLMNVNGNIIIFVKKIGHFLVFHKFLMLFQCKM